MGWDLDGTIVDSIGLIVASYQHAFTTVLGHPWDEAEIKSWIGQSLYGAMQMAKGSWPTSDTASPIILNITSNNCRACDQDRNTVYSASR